ncbi:phosphatidylinositol alpha-1,6-mannosyltransferase [Crossiella equi]|uniref:Phosphatidylinositol alpha-1,6-mannosyltransferase n=1 Tax=Crossiella equi TaxID=130796 RepID=A0ABS5AB13_9PSEU|nr:glycosyltransferase family 4 protein [Crossiella equi]MBP2473779.1 phosphatidylinositol alpha-1,6-mannosyltransferase [Crossiella equi]
MRRTLLVTSVFPPRPGSAQAYLHGLARALPPDSLVVYAPAGEGVERFDAREPFPVVRHPGLLLPDTEAVAGAGRVLRAEGCSAVWFGAAAPLGLLGARLRRAGARRVVASSLAHEVGWAMLPGARWALRRMGSAADVVTCVSRCTRAAIASALGPLAALEHLPPGVDTTWFRPDSGARREVRRRHGLGEAPVVLCVSRLVPRKGQDALVRALPHIRARVPGARLLLVGGGAYRKHLRKLADRAAVAEHVVFAGTVPAVELPAYYAAGDVFAMPCRTTGGGLDVEGLGLVFLEAAASGLPVVAGRSGSAPETVREGETGTVVDGRSVRALAESVSRLLADPDRAAAMGRAGREWMRRAWRWEAAGARLAGYLEG